MYQNYIFDLYGTLVDIHTDENDSMVWEKLALFYGYQGAVYAPEELKKMYEKTVQALLTPHLPPSQIIEKYERLIQLSGSGKPKGYATAKRMFLEAGAERKEKMAGAETDKVVHYSPEGIPEIQIENSHEGIPEIQIERVFKQMYMAKGVKPDESLVLHTCQLFRGLTTEYIRLYPGVHEMFAALKKKGKKVYLLSNAQRVFTEYELNVLDIAKYFDAILISSDYRVKKPDLSFFKILLDKYELKAEESIMIGNDENCDIAGAQRAGLDTYYIHSNISPDYTGSVKATYMQMEMDIDKVCRTLGILD